MAHSGKMPGPGQGVLALGLLAPQVPSQVLFRVLRASGKAGDRAGEKGEEGKGKEPGRCGGWGETKNVSTLELMHGCLAK